MYIIYVLIFIYAQLFIFIFFFILLLLVYFEMTSLSSVLLSIKLGILTVDNALISLMYDYIK